MASGDLSAYRAQHDAIREEFKRQAVNWGKDQISPDLQWVVARLDLQPHFEVLDVAAGTGLLSRAVAPHVKRVVAVDITPEMLAQGRDESRRQEIRNVDFEDGAAEALPYPAGSFDVVMTRFSMHHFQSPEAAAREMHRVCRSGGSLVVIDIVSPHDAEIATRYNAVERLRDPSHTRALSPAGLKSLVGSTGAEVTSCYSREVEMIADDWLDFTQTESGRRRQVLDLLQRERDGGEETGMRPFLKDGKQMFLHTWGIVVGRKR